MAEAPTRYVCDLTLLMRARLLCGLYNRRAVPPRWRLLARAYCAIVTLVTLSFIYSTSSYRNVHASFLLLPSYCLYYVSALISLWTGDDYIYIFFTQNKLTDVTLDSPRIFYRLQKQINRACIAMLLFYFLLIGHLIVIHMNSSIISSLSLAIPGIVLDMLLACTNTTKLLVMGLFDARLLVLKRRLQRYGFRSAGRVRPQPYSDIYHQILQDLDATDNPLKLLLLWDWICNCFKITAITAYYLHAFVQWKEYRDIKLTSISFILTCVMSSGNLLFQSFGHVALLESAAAHCEDMLVFTVTQLIKIPTAEERRWMYAFLDALEERGARYRVLRVLPLNARLVLAALSFCSANTLLIYNIITKP